MKKILLSLVLAVVTISCSQAQKTEFEPATLKSEMVSTDKSTTVFQRVIDQNRGKIIVIDVWATWCPDCIKGFRKSEDLKKQFPDVQYVYISMDRNFESWTEGIQKYKLDGQHYWIPQGMKGVFGKSIDLNWIPRYIVVDKKGRIAQYNSIEADDTKMTTVLKELQNRK